MIDIPRNIAKRQVITGDIVTLDDNMILSEVLLRVAELNVSIRDVFFDRDWGYQDDPDTWTVKYTRMETDDEYDARIATFVQEYKARMAEIDAKAEKKKALRNDKDWKEFQRLKKKFGNQ